MSTIPISQIVQIVPGVITAGGAASRLTGLVFTQDVSLPASIIKQFNTATDVSNWFGPSAPETTLGNGYFPGIVNGGQLPGVLKFARYAATATPAGSYGASLAGVTLAALQAFSGTLIVTVGGVLATSSTINLAAATSFANAATLMLAGFTTPNFSIVYDTQRNRFTLLSTATGSAATSTDVSGTLAANVGLSQAAGATIALFGIEADTPATALARVVALDTNWGTFTTSWAATIGDRELFATANATYTYQYVYVAWDTEMAGLVPNNPSSFGSVAFSTPYQGTWPVYGTQFLAGGLMGYAASINFNIPNGRTTAAFRQFNAAIPATVSDLASANALLTNHYTYLGAYANAANNYTVTYAGAISGAFLWADTYLNQIYLNREIQRASFEYMIGVNSIPYNQDGYDGLYRAAVDVIDAGVTSGIIRGGVTLSQSQKQQIDTQAGVTGVSDVVATRGWYYLVQNPANPAQARQNRTSPQATLWYSDGGSVQQLTINSIAVI